MTNKKRYENAARLLIGALIGIMITLLLLFVGSQVKAAEPKTGYLVVTRTEKPRHTAVFRVTSAAVADSILANHFGNSIQGFSTAEALKSSPYYRHERMNFNLYVERKRVVYVNGKMKMRKWKR